VQSDVAAVVREATSVFTDLGHSVEPFSGGPPQLAYDWGMVGAFELYGQLEEFLPDREGEFGRGFIGGVKAGASMTPALWTAARRRRGELNRWCADVFSRYDLLLMPTVPYDAPPAGGPFPEEVEGRRANLGAVGSFTIPSISAGIPARPCGRASRRPSFRSAYRSSARGIAMISCSRPRTRSSKCVPGPITGRRSSLGVVRAGGLFCG
jgi:Asp-tRNA(Asn)/Glu-tRNA(Gln) amidotransferase A subunit family amidase